MEKEYGRLKKRDDTDIVVRADDFGGKRGLTIREFVSNDRYTGFTKAGVRITSENFPKFKEMINSISEEDMKESSSEEGEENKEDKASSEGESDNSEASSGEKDSLPDY
jgi:hypothetical protein